MRKDQTQHMPRKIKHLDFNGQRGEVNRAWQRKADAVQARRWRKLSHEMKQSPYIDSRVKQGGGIL